MTDAEVTNGRPEFVKRLAASWPTIVSIVGLAGSVVLLFQPGLRGDGIILLFGGAAGIDPANRLLNAVGGKK